MLEYKKVFGIRAVNEHAAKNWKMVNCWPTPIWDQLFGVPNVTAVMVRNSKPKATRLD